MIQMTFGVDMRSAARRHLLAADILMNGERRDVAGYLYGIAAECAIKAMMSDVGMRPKAPHRTPSDPFFEHFPELRTLLRDHGQLRSGAPLARFINTDSFMNNWSTGIRYCHSREVREHWVSAWKEQAKQAVACIGT